MSVEANAILISIDNCIARQSVAVYGDSYLVLSLKLIKTYFSFPAFGGQTAQKIDGKGEKTGKSKGKQS